MKTKTTLRSLSMLLVLASLFLCACPAPAPDTGSSTTTTTTSTTTIGGGGGLPPVSATLTADKPYAAAENEGVTLTAAADGVTGNWQFSYPDGIVGSPKSPSSVQIYAERAGVYTVTATNGSATATCTVSFYDGGGTYTADSALIKYVGRTEASGTTRIINISASGFEVAFYGKALKMKMNSANSPYIPVGNGDGECRFSIFIDGETDPSAKELTVATETNGDYTLASFAEVGYHRVRIQRQSEHRYATTTLLSLQVEDGGLLPVPASTALKIEAFGDSITAGVGARRSPSVADGMYFDYDSSLHTYAGLAAASLGAEFSAMAVAGAGLCDTPMDGHNANYFLKNFYNRVAFEKTTVFPAADYVPDIVIINIGTNDLNSQAKYEESEYKATYIQLVKNLAARYAGHDVTFILCSGMMDTVLASVVADVADSLMDENIYAVAVNFTRAASGHPNKAEHTAYGEKLAGVIREIYGIAE